MSLKKKKKSEESRQTGKKRPKTLFCCHIKLQVNKFYSNHHLYVGRSGGVLNGEFLLSSETRGGTVVVRCSISASGVGDHVTSDGNMNAE